MAYKKQEIIDQCLKVIEDECIFFIEELLAFVPISKGTFYKWKMNEMDSIKNAITQGKIKGKNHLRKKWMQSENATTDIALYKLLADDDEIEKLSSNYTPKTDNDKTALKFEVSLK